MSRSEVVAAQSYRLIFFCLAATHLSRAFPQLVDRFGSQGRQAGQDAEGAMERGGGMELIRRCCWLAAATHKRPDTTSADDDGWKCRQVRGVMEGGRAGEQRASAQVRVM